MATKIDFPDQPVPGATHLVNVDGVETLWTYSPYGSWVKTYEYVEDVVLIDSEQYCRKNKAWEIIVFPISEDAPDNGAIHGRQSNAWVEADFGAAGPAFNQTLFPTPGVYSMDWATENWVISNDSDLEANYYDKTISDGRFSGINHNHDISTLTNVGTLATEDDTLIDGIPYIRLDGAWEPLSDHTPAVQILKNSITIIDPIDSDDAMIMWTPVEINIQDIRCNTRNGASVTFNIYAASTANNSSGDLIKVFTVDYECTLAEGEAPVPDVTVIPADSWVWLEITNSTAGSTMFHTTITYLEA